MIFEIWRLIYQLFLLIFAPHSQVCQAHGIEGAFSELMVETRVYFRFNK